MIRIDEEQGMDDVEREVKGEWKRSLGGEEGREEKERKRREEEGEKRGRRREGRRKGGGREGREKEGEGERGCAFHHGVWWGKEIVS